MELTTQLNVSGHLAIQYNSEVYLMQVINRYFHKTKSYTLSNRELGPCFQARLTTIMLKIVKDIGYTTMMGC